MHALKETSYDFSLKVIKLVNNFPRKQVFWIIGDQLLRSATSIGANIVEAQGAYSRKEFASFYQIALKSSVETHYWLCLLKDSDASYIDSVTLLLQINEELTKMLKSSLITVKSKDKV